MKKRISRIKIIALACFMLISLIPSYMIYATNEENVIADFKQTYVEDTNTVLVEATTQAMEGYEVTAIQKQNEEKIEGIENIYTIDENGEYTFIIYYHKTTELEDKIEEKREYTVAVDTIIDEDKITKSESTVEQKEDTDIANKSKSDTRGARFVTNTEAGFVLDSASGIQLKYDFRSDGTASIYQNNISPGSNIIKPDGFSGVFYIPSTAEYKGSTYTVTELANYATNRWNIEIVLPDTITTIGTRGLQGITNKEIVIPASVNKMGSSVVKEKMQVRLMGTQAIRPIDPATTNKWHYDFSQYARIVCNSKAVYTAQVASGEYDSYDLTALCYESENKIRFHDENGNYIPSLDYTYLVGTSRYIAGEFFNFKKVDGIWEYVATYSSNRFDGNVLPSVPSNTKGYNAWAKSQNAFAYYGAGDGPGGLATIDIGFTGSGPVDKQLDLYPTWAFGTVAPAGQGYTIEKVYDGTETPIKFNTVGAVDRLSGSKYTFQIIGKKGNTVLFDEFPINQISNREIGKATNVADSAKYSVQSIFTDTQYPTTGGGPIGFDPGAVPWSTRGATGPYIISNTTSSYELKITPATAVVNPKTTTTLKWQNQTALPTIELDVGSTPGTITWNAGETPQIGTKSYKYTYVPNNAYAKDALNRDVANYTNPSVQGTMSITYANITSIDITSKTPIVTRGGEKQMTAKVTGVGNPSLTVTWSVSGHTSANTNIDASGILTIGTDETAGSNIIVKATSTYDPSQSATTTVTVSSPIITSITLKATPDKVHRGASSNITATVIGNGYPSQAVTWSVSGHTSADTNINADGKLTIGTDETAGSNIIVKAISKYDTSKSATTTVGVLAPTITSVTLKATPDKVHRGASSNIAPTIIGNGHPSQEVTWKIAGHTSVDTSIDADGKLTIGVDETAGATILVTATSTYDPSKSGVSTVTVLAPTVTEITVKATPDKVHRGASSNITATVLGKGHPSQEVTWKIAGHTSVGTSIDVDGKLTIGVDETAGSMILVTATSVYDGSQSQSIAIKVLEPYITDVETPFDTLRISSGTQKVIEAVVTGVGYPNLDVIWEISGNTSDKTVISNDGELAIDRDEKAGDEIVIKAISKADNTKFSTINIIVTSTVHFDTLGGSEVPDYIDVLKGTIKEPVQPTFKDYVFTGWYKDEEYQEKWDFDKNVLDENITLYAKWETYRFDADEESQKKGSIVFEESRDLDENLYIDKVNDKMNIDLPELRGVYDIYLLKGNDRVKVENEKIEIALLLSEEEKGFAYYKVVYISEGGDIIEEYNPILSEDKNYLYFETTHLSYYGIIGWNDKEPEIIKPEIIKPETRDETNIGLWAQMLFVSMGLGLTTLVKRKKTQAK